MDDDDESYEYARYYASDTRARDDSVRRVLVPGHGKTPESKDENKKNKKNHDDDDDKPRPILIFRARARARQAAPPAAVAAKDLRQRNAAAAPKRGSGRSDKTARARSRLLTCCGRFESVPRTQVKNAPSTAVVRRRPLTTLLASTATTEVRYRVTLVFFSPLIRFAPITARVLRTAEGTTRA